MIVAGGRSGYSVVGFVKSEITPCGAVVTLLIEHLIIGS